MPKKTVKAYSLPLDETTFGALNNLFISYGKCRSLFFNEFCGINNITLNFYDVRNSIRKSGRGLQLTKCYQFLGKHWVYALFDTTSNIKSMWTNLKKKLRSSIRNNLNISDNQRHYLFFILKFDTLYQAILKNYKHLYSYLPEKFHSRFLELQGKLSKEEQRHAHSYLKRITRRYKPKPNKKGTFNKSMTYDETMYRFSSATEVHLTSSQPYKTFKFHLTSPWHYSHKGNLTLVLDRTKKRLEIHKLISTKQRKIPKLQPLGIDKGLTNLISTSTGNEYGVGFGQEFYKEVERLSQRNASRNKMRSKNALKGSKNYLDRKNRHKAYLVSLINKAILEMIKHEKPSVIVKEDLTFTNDKFKGKYAKTNRLLSSWLKGILDERLEYIASLYGIPVVDVNPAYTSQYCPHCNQPYEKRYGKHNELVLCKTHGVLNANTSAAINILSRKDDKEISLYTPYLKVKEILENR